MAASSSTTTATISCCCPAPPKQAAAAGSRRPQAPARVSVSSSSHALRRACVAAAACAVMGLAGGGGGVGGADMALALARGGGVVFASRTDAVPVDAAMRAARAKATPPRWSDRRQCPPWRANSLENIVPENLPRPRPSAPRRFGSFSVSAAEGAALRPGTECFSL